MNALSSEANSPSQETREELHELFWSAPPLTVAEKFGVSDVALAKTCRKLKIPLSGRGYWAKKAAGKPVHHQALPALSPNSSAIPRTISAHKDR